MSRIVHFEVPADDPERVIHFYEEVFGWRFEKWDGPMEYWLVMTGPEEDPGIDGGMAKRTEPDIGVELTIDVADLDQAITGVEANGGEIIRSKHAVLGVGWLAYFKDTEGNIFGMMQNDPDAA